MGTGESDFHVVAIHVLATPNATSINFILCLLRFLLTVVKLPKRQSSGSNGKGASIILASVSQMSYQNVLTLIHCHVQCRKEPTSVPHLKHKSEVSGL